MTAAAQRRLPPGLLVAWYGDDFTGSAAVMEVLTFSGLESVLFFDIPTPAQLARFPQARGIGIAGLARAMSPEWMERELPPIFAAIADLGAPVTHYKICSTFDSAPNVGSIGKAVDLAAPFFPGGWYPLVPAAPAIHRYQAFGNLFAGAGDAAYRLDRHPTMRCHPVTPMAEADVRMHLSKQTDLPVGLIDLVAMKNGRAADAVRSERGRGARIIALDVVDDETLRIAGGLIWEAAEGRLLAVGSQGVENALVAHWQSIGALPPVPYHPKAKPAARMAVVSGSCSPVTARQIDWAEAHGFRPIRLDAARAVDESGWREETGRAVSEALRVLSEGHDPIIYTARGPEDIAISGLREAVSANGNKSGDVNARIGDGLGRVLDRILRETGLSRAVIAGGDTSGHGALALGVYALTALAPTVPGASIFKAHSEDPVHRDLELALKGGQMGTEDYFGRVKDGGGPIA